VDADGDGRCDHAPEGRPGRGWRHGWGWRHGRAAVDG
jgi:hypothetical protein